MVATGSASYQAVPQEDSIQPGDTRSPRPSSPIRPAIYFGEGPFSPTSSSEGSHAEKPRGHAFLADDDDDTYRDGPSSPIYVESGLRRKAPVSAHRLNLVRAESRLASYLFR